MSCFLESVREKGGRRAKRALCKRPSHVNGSPKLDSRNKGIIASTLTNSIIISTRKEICPLHLQLPPNHSLRSPPPRCLPSCPNHSANPTPQSRIHTLLRRSLWRPTLQRISHHLLRALTSRNISIFTTRKANLRLALIKRIKRLHHSIRKRGDVAVRMQDVPGLRAGLGCAGFENHEEGVKAGQELRSGTVEGLNCLSRERGVSGRVFDGEVHVVELVWVILERLAEKNHRRANVQSCPVKC